MAVEGAILVVDDDEASRKLLTQLLSSQGFTVATARDAEEALTRIAQVSPDLLLLDVKLPDEDGRTLCRRLRMDGATSRLPIVLMTAYPDSAKMCLASGADAIIQKPFKREEVVSWVRCLVRARHADAGSEGIERVLFSIAASIEARSEYSEDHLWRVAQFSEQLASALGLSDTKVATVRRAALIHDIGMIGVPEHVLRQPRSLTPMEFTQVKPHTVLGASLARGLSGGDAVSALVRGHHERWSGGGYPDNLTGEDIPLGARILAVADAFDALTTDRPYRSALTINEALDVLWFGADTQWDPHLVEVFASLVQPSRESTKSNDRRHGLTEAMIRYMILTGDRQ